MIHPLRKRVYIAGPMSLGDRVDNLAQALKAFRWLRANGFAPLCPQLSFFVADILPGEHVDWLTIDLPWVAVADAVLLLPGDSAGADMETDTARRHGVPVFYDRESLLNHFRRTAVPAVAPIDTLCA